MAAVRSTEPSVSKSVSNRFSLLSNGPRLVSAVAIVLTLSLVPFGTHRLSATVSFVPALLSVVACLDLLTVYLLLGEFHSHGDRRVLAMSCAYLWSLVLMAAYSLAFPGVFSNHPPLAIAPSLAPWYYLGWHVGFPFLLGLSWAPWPRRLRATTSPERRRSVGWLAMVVVVCAAAAVAALGAIFAHGLPVLIHGRDTSRMTELTAPVAVPLVVLALAAAITGTRRRTGAERWVAVAVLVCLCDLVLTYSSRYRFSLGWYSGRALTLTAAAVVLLAMLTEFRRAKIHAEFYAAYDSLTGLANHRSTHDTFGRMFALSRRSGQPMSVIALDLDFFKRINDSHGHAAGDQLLTDVGAALIGAVRLGDLVGRVGGEEFLALLPNTNLDGARTVAERMGAAVRAQRVVGAVGAPTASMGVACSYVGDSGYADLLQRADQALYGAKAAGRNQVQLAATDVTSLVAERVTGLPEARKPHDCDADGHRPTPVPGQSAAHE